MYWVWQKLLFVLGGLMLPLELYPEVDAERRGVHAVSGACSRDRRRWCWEGAVVTPVALARSLALWSVVTAVAVCWCFGAPRRR